MIFIIPIIMSYFVIIVITIINYRLRYIIIRPNFAIVTIIIFVITRILILDGSSSSDAHVWPENRLFDLFKAFVFTSTVFHAEPGSLQTRASLNALPCTMVINMICLIDGYSESACARMKDCQPEGVLELSLHGLDVGVLDQEGGAQLNQENNYFK